MPLHDWTRASPNTFHDMHVSWIAAIRTRLNTGLLPDGYYALAEQKAEPFVPDVRIGRGGLLTPPQATLVSPTR